MPRDPKAELDALDGVFRALAHPSRRQILLALHFRGGEMSAGDIAGRFACSWPTTTRHLKQLCEANLIQVQRRGRERYYQLQRECLKDTVQKWLGWFDQSTAS